MGGLNLSARRSENLEWEADEETSNDQPSVRVFIINPILTHVSHGNNNPLSGDCWVHFLLRGHDLRPSELSPLGGKEKKEKSGNHVFITILMGQINILEPN